MYEIEGTNDIGEYPCEQKYYYRTWTFSRRAQRHDDDDERVLNDPGRDLQDLQKIDYRPTRGPLGERWIWIWIERKLKGFVGYVESSYNNNIVQVVWRLVFWTPTEFDGRTSRVQIEKKEKKEKEKIRLITKRLENLLKNTILESSTDFWFTPRFYLNNKVQAKV